MAHQIRRQVSETWTSTEHFTRQLSSSKTLVYIVGRGTVHTQPTSKRSRRDGAQVVEGRVRLSDGVVWYKLDRQIEAVQCIARIASP